MYSWKNGWMALRWNPCTYHPSTGHTWKSSTWTWFKPHLLNLSSNSIIPTTEVKTRLTSTTFHFFIYVFFLVCARVCVFWYGLKNCLKKESQWQIFAWFLFHRNSSKGLTSSIYNIYTVHIIQLLKFWPHFSLSYLPHLGHYASHPPIPWLTFDIKCDPFFYYVLLYSQYAVKCHLW